MYSMHTSTQTMVQMLLKLVQESELVEVELKVKDRHVEHTHVERSGESGEACLEQIISKHNSVSDHNNKLFVNYVHTENTIAS